MVPLAQTMYLGVIMDRKLKARIVEKFGHQWRFAHKIGWHEYDVSAVIRGNRVLSQEEQDQWAQVLGCDLADLFGDGDE